MGTLSAVAPKLHGLADEAPAATSVEKPVPGPWVRTSAQCYRLDAGVDHGQEIHGYPLTGDQEMEEVLK